MAAAVDWVGKDSGDDWERMNDAAESQKALRAACLRRYDSGRAAGWTNASRTRVALIRALARLPGSHEHEDHCSAHTRLHAGQCHAEHCKE